MSEDHVDRFLDLVEGNGELFMFAIMSRAACVHLEANAIAGNLTHTQLVTYATTRTMCDCAHEHYEHTGEIPVCFLCEDEIKQKVEAFAFVTPKEPDPEKRHLALTMAICTNCCYKHGQALPGVVMSEVEQNFGFGNIQQASRVRES